MTQHQAILYLLRQRPQTTNDLIQSPYGLAAEFRRAISTLRAKGYDIRYVHGKGGTGTYTLHAEPPVLDTDGQYKLACAA